MVGRCTELIAFFVTHQNIQMETVFVFVLPIILSIASIVFMRTCCDRADGKPIPRILCYGLVVLAYHPDRLVDSVRKHFCRDDCQFYQRRSSFERKLYQILV